MILASCSPSLESRLDRVLKPVFPEGQPGAAVLVMKGDSILYDKGFGLANMETGAHLDGDTPMNVASVSKQFTAVAVLQLVQEGKVSLEDPVSKYFPEFESGIWEEITLAHLLSHSSGVPDERDYLTREQKIYADDTLSVEYMKTLDHRNFAPGTAYEYVNPTYTLLGFLIERVSGEPFIEYMHKHVLQPAGMDKSYYFDRDHQNPAAAHGYVSIDDSWQELDFGEEAFFATRPDGGLYTTTHEYVKWIKALRSGAVLDKDLLTLAMTPHTEASYSHWSDYQNRANTWYGYGWFIEPAKGGAPQRIYHPGDNGGFRILAAGYPVGDLCVLVFSNRADWDRYDLYMKLEKELLTTN